MVVIYDSPTFAKSIVRAHVHVCVPLLLACTAYSRCRSLRRKGTDRIQQPAELRNKMKDSVCNVCSTLQQASHTFQYTSARFQHASARSSTLQHAWTRPRTPQHASACLSTPQNALISAPACSDRCFEFGENAQSTVPTRMHARAPHQCVFRHLTYAGETYTCYSNDL